MNRDSRKVISGMLIINNSISICISVVILLVIKIDFLPFAECDGLLGLTHTECLVK